MKENTQANKKSPDEILEDTKAVKDVVHKIESDEQRKLKRKRLFRLIKRFVFILFLLSLVIGGIVIGLKLYPIGKSWLIAHNFINENSEFVKEANSENEKTTTEQNTVTYIDPVGSVKRVSVAELSNNIISNTQSIVSIISFEEWQRLKDARGGIVVKINNGVVIDKDGIIITTMKSIRDDITYVVILSNGKSYPIVDIVKDYYTGLALVKIDAKNLLSVQLTEDYPEIGDQIWNLGNPLSECEGCVSTGFVSATHVIVDNGKDDFIPVSNSILIDSTVLQEFIGGPVFDNQGKMIGILIDSISEEGIVIPSNHIKFILDRYKVYGEIVPDSLGIRFVYVNNARSILSGEGTMAGVLITDVIKEGKAEQLGLQKNDVITAVNDIPVIENFFSDLLLENADDLKLTVWRDGRSIEIPNSQQ